MLKNFINKINQKKYFKEIMDYFVSKNVIKYYPNEKLYELTDNGINLKKYCELIITNKMQDKPCDMYFEEIIDNMPFEYVANQTKKKLSYLSKIVDIDDILTQRECNIKTSFIYNFLNSAEIIPMV